MDMEVNWMPVALQEGHEAIERGEVPIGCVYVSSDGIELARGSNRCNEMRDGTRHAELVAYEQMVLRMGTARVREEFSRGVDLYVTCEPCIMCCAALALLKVRHVVFGCKNEKFGGCGSVRAIHESRSTRIPGIVSVKGGVFAEEAIEMLQKFYTQENLNAPEPKKKRQRTLHT
ncbi:hypothetical protein NDN08_002731 [Rhodosorus marinus]|uniref:CMP/dCMP-type deaminase domain-containing protein n=1 Tax=Rhodosorus marinus TaxID=101924 RepID=A0AAV8UYY2_9RHOD|nr:hypothetical protein NDN08_002731 [Rhodosorus marinus]